MEEKWVLGRRGEDFTIIDFSDDVTSEGRELITNLFKEKGYIMKLFRPTAYNQSPYIIKW